MEKRDHGMQAPSTLCRPNSALSPARSAAGELSIWSRRHPAALGRSDALPGHDRAGVPHAASVQASIQLPSVGGSSREEDLNSCPEQDLKGPAWNGGWRGRVVSAQQMLFILAQDLDRLLPQAQPLADCGVPFALWGTGTSLFLILQRHFKKILHVMVYFAKASPFLTAEVKFCFKVSLSPEACLPKGYPGRAAKSQWRKAGRGKGGLVIQGDPSWSVVQLSGAEVLQSSRPPGWAGLRLL